MIDNYDSFTFNLVQLFLKFGLQVIVARHDEITIKEIEELLLDYICISPGPKNPEKAGISKEVVLHFGNRIPLLGVCLGMQVINRVFEGKTVCAPVPVHGKRDRVYHTGESIFSGIPSPFWAARYHSLCIDMCSSELKVLAYARDGVVMGICHRSFPMYGVQFHPESFLTEYGERIIENFLSFHKQGEIHI